MIGSVKMSFSFGSNIHISIFGQSHSDAIGVTIEGIPAGFRPDTEALAAFLSRRAPGNSEFSTPRKEADAPEFICGLVNGTACGSPITAIIKNTNTRPSDYASLSDVPRPGHADYTAHVKYKGFEDPTGGGHFSGRMTAPLCIAGGLFMQLLGRAGIKIGAHIQSIGNISDIHFDPCRVSEEDMRRIHANILPVLSAEADEKMRGLIRDCKIKGDSIGGVIECAIIGVPVGIGEPVFHGMENVISQCVFAIPAVKGIEFGSGFDGCAELGSVNNDPFTVENGEVRTVTNNHGGILGGITSGMPIIFRAAVKPTPSIGAVQQSVKLSSLEDTALSVKGRHDPCILPRAVPCVEAAAAIALYDMIKNEINEGSV